MRTVDQYLYGVVQAQSQEDFDEVKGDGDRSATGKRDYGSRSSVRSSISDVSLPKLSERLSEPQPELEANNAARHDH